MDRFVAMIWNPIVPTRTQQVERWSGRLHASHWRRVLDRPGFRVFAFAHEGSAPVIAEIGAHGVVIGRLFKRDDEAGGRVRRLSRPASEALIASRGESLVRDYWGNYLAFWTDHDDRSANVLRDPCGATPCFSKEAMEVRLLFSHADDVARFPGCSWSIDWTYLQAFLLFNYFVTAMTGIDGLSEVLPGERVTWGGAGASEHEFAWNGAAIAASPHRLSFADICEETRAIGEACFCAWGGAYRSILASLSGGLDSSILVNLLSRAANTKVTAIHYVGAGYESYELKLARLAADRAGIEFVAVEQDPAREDLARILKAPLAARPKVQSLGVLIDDLSSELAERVGADAFMIGHGGDNLFLQRGGALHTLGDYLRLEGFGARFWQIAYEAAVLKQQSVWGVLAGAVKDASPKKRWIPHQILERGDWMAYRPLKPEAVRALPARYRLHPWLAEAAHLPSGKGEHLASIVALYNYHLHHGRAIERDVVYPFVSQPLVEFALKTPTYVLAHGGLDRAVERAAFGDLIPEEILRRTGKSGADHYLLRVLAHHFDFFRELVLDGELIRQDWVARERVEALLRPGFTTQGAGALFIYLIAAAEAWLATWRGQAASNTAAAASIGG